MGKSAFGRLKSKNNDKSLLLCLRLCLIFCVMLALGYYLAQKGQAGVQDGFFEATSTTDGAVEFFVSVCKSSRLELILVFAIGLGALTFFCKLVACASLAVYGFACGAYAAALLYDGKWYLLIAYLLTSVVIAYALLRFSLRMVTANHRFLSAEARKSSGFYFSPLLIKYAFVFLKAFLVVFAIRSVYGYLTLFLI